MADVIANSADNAVIYNLENADKVQDIHGDVHAATESVGGPQDHAGPAPSVFGMDATVWVSLSMAVFIGILIWKKVPAAIGRALDGKIATIRSQLDEAAALRAQAEALKAEYESKLASAAADAAAMRAKAESDAAQTLVDAKAHAAELIVRRQKMAEDKIAAAERSAIADIRQQAVKAATGAAAALIVAQHDAKADKALVDGAIKGLDTAH